MVNFVPGPAALKPQQQGNALKTNNKVQIHHLSNTYKSENANFCATEARSKQTCRKWRCN